MINKLLKYKYLLAIILLAAFVRMFWLSSYPISLSVDEAAIGYDAFSILKSGRDSHQKFMPMIFESIGDFKPGFYIYLTTVSELFFGVNEFSVRFTSALAGTITVLFVYLLTITMIKKESVSLLTAFVLALSPWHIKISRVASEANVAYCLLSIGLYLSLRSIVGGKKNNWGILFFCLSMYTYHTEKILAPILFLSLIIIFRKNLTRAIIARWLLLFVFFSLPFAFSLNSQDQSRAVAKFVRNDPIINITLDRMTDHQLFGSWIMSGLLIVRRYVQIFDFGTIINKGLDLTHSRHLDLGWVYWLETPFLFLGLITLVKKTKSVFKEKRFFYVFLVWLVLSPLTASITMDDYHPYRLLTLTYFLSLTIALGIYLLNKFLLTKFSKAIVCFSFGIIYLINFGYLIDYYLVHFPVQKSDWVFDPFKKVALVALENRYKYDQIVIDNNFGKLGPYTFGLPMTYILFYGQIPPDEYARTKETGLDKYSIRKIDWAIEKYQKNTLLIGSPWSLPEKDIDPDLIKEKINFFDGSPAYLVVSTKEANK